MRRTFEKYYPITIGLVVAFVFCKLKMNYICSKNLCDALNAAITIASIVIGFLGAILPVILGMKNSSKFVRYVFELDKDKLFLKYIKATIASGILSIVISMILFFNDIFTNTIIHQYIFYVWVGCMVYMLLCTYRSVSCMMELMFKEDDENIAEGEISATQDTKVMQERAERKVWLDSNIPKVELDEGDG